MGILLLNANPSEYGFLRDTLGLGEKTLGALGITALAVGAIGAYYASPTVRSLVDRCVLGQPSRNRGDSREVRAETNLVISRIKGKEKAERNPRQSMEIRKESNPEISRIKEKEKSDPRHSIEVGNPRHSIRTKILSSEEKLYQACNEKNMDSKKIFSILQRKDLNINARVNGETSLHALCRNGQKLLVDIFLRNGANPKVLNTKRELAFALLPKENLNQRFLETTLLEDDEEMAQLLLECGAKVNIKDKNGNTPLHHACAKGFKKLVEVLLKRRANINAQNNRGATPLDCAHLFNQDEIIKLLRAKDAQFGKKNHDFLDFEEELGSSEKVDVFDKHFEEKLAELHKLQKKYGFPLEKNVNAKNDKGQTLLRVVCKKATVDNMDDILILEDLGANPRRLDSQGRSCYNYLSDSVHIKLAKKKQARGGVPEQWMQSIKGVPKESKRTMGGLE